ncbi:hypothetical protein BU23DRAFT_630209, partial [Bimuria novae-zelandiae CBS 107.79]
QKPGGRRLLRLSPRLSRPPIPGGRPIGGPRGGRPPRPPRPPCPPCRPRPPGPPLCPLPCLPMPGGILSGAPPNILELSLDPGIPLGGLGPPGPPAPCRRPGPPIPEGVLPGGILPISNPTSGPPIIGGRPRRPPCAPGPRRSSRPPIPGGILPRCISPISFLECGGRGGPRGSWPAPRPTPSINSRRIGSHGVIPWFLLFEMCTVGGKDAAFVDPRGNLLFERSF